MFYIFVHQYVTCWILMKDSCVLGSNCSVCYGSVSVSHTHLDTWQVICNWQLFGSQVAASDGQFINHRQLCPFDRCITLHAAENPSPFLLVFHVNLDYLLTFIFLSFSTYSGREPWGQVARVLQPSLSHSHYYAPALGSIWNSAIRPYASCRFFDACQYLNTAEICNCTK